MRAHGSYLRNVRPPLGARQPHGTALCTLCGTPTSGHALCYPCRAQDEQASQVGLPLADRVGFVTYAVEGVFPVGVGAAPSEAHRAAGRQAYAILKGYKTARRGRDVGSGSPYWLPMAALVRWALLRHGPCAHVLSGMDAPLLWATVPSSRSSRAGEHPLHALVSAVWGSRCRETGLAFAEGSPVPRTDLSANSYQAEPIAPGSHVLLVDDSWVTGASTQSAAVALRRAGAAQVSAFVMGRVLRADWPPTCDFIRGGGLDFVYRADLCPWTGQSC